MSDFVTFVVNPAAARGLVGLQGGQIRGQITKIAGNQPHQIVFTEGTGHAIEIARNAPAASRVVAVGGDGTVHEIIRGIAKTDKAIGVVPAGSGNDFARMLGLKGVGFEAAIAIALHQPIHTLDLGFANDEPFGSSLGIGFDAAVARKSLTAPKFLRGLPRYLYSIFAVLRELSLPELTLEADGQTLYQGKALMVALMNGPTYGAGIPIVPEASARDGMISGALVMEISKMGVLGILPKLLQGQHIYDPRLKLFSGKEFTVRFDRTVPGQVDGEMLEPTAFFRVHLIPQGLRVIESAVT